MIEQQARVVEASEDLAIVRVGGRSGCPSCDAGRGCGAGIFGRLLNRNPIELSLPNTVSARTGQAVVIGLPEQLLVRAACRFYLLPLVLAILAAVLMFAFARWVSESAMLADGLAALGLVAGFVLAYRYLHIRPMEFPGRRIVHLIRVLPAAN